MWRGIYSIGIACMLLGGGIVGAQELSIYDSTQDSRKAYYISEDRDPSILLEERFEDEEGFTEEDREQKEEAEYELNALEDLYSERSGEELRQYGYDIFQDIEKPALKRTPPQGRVSDDYVLGAGDVLEITFLGERQKREVYEVEPSGMIVIEAVGPVNANGLTVQEFEDALDIKLGEIYLETEAHVSLSAMRQIGVLVMGEVKRPGKVFTSAQSDMIEVLSLAEGIKRTGSLRRIKLIRAGKPTYIDLYDILLDGDVDAFPSLRDGDRVIVPTLGQTMAIAGQVKRPGIYEVLVQNSAPVDHFINMAGGMLTRGNANILLISEDGDIGDAPLSVTPKSTIAGIDGAILQVNRFDPQMTSSVTLRGAVRHRGAHHIGDNAALAEILKGIEFFKTEAYMHFGVIERVDPQSLSTYFIPFSPLAVLSGEAELSLDPHDTIYILTKEEATGAFEDDAWEGNESVQEKILAMIDAHAIAVEGAVLAPGEYPVTQALPIEEALKLAGGPLAEADLDRIEVTQTAQKERSEGRMTMSENALRYLTSLDETENATLFSGDSIAVPKRFSDIHAQAQYVQILGEVKYPGRYALRRGDTMLDLMNRAGGITEQAYPEGAIFSRKSEREREAEQNMALAMQLEQGLASAINSKDDLEDGTFELVKNLTETLKSRKTVGRIEVEADPAILKANEAQNILLQNGDKIYIPQRAITVRVAGEVLAPAVLQYRQSKDARDYLDGAGGLTHFADRDRAFVVYPDGAAEPLNLSRFAQQASVKIPPMSIIYVPRDPKPFDWIEGARNVSQILSSLALTGIFLDDLGEDD